MKSPDEKLIKLEARLKVISDQREKNINRFILPLEIKMEKLNDEIFKLKYRTP